MKKHKLLFNSVLITAVLIAGISGCAVSGSEKNDTSESLTDTVPNAGSESLTDTVTNDGETADSGTVSLSEQDLNDAREAALAHYKATFNVTEIELIPYEDITDTEFSYDGKIHTYNKEQIREFVAGFYVTVNPDGVPRHIFLTNENGNWEIISEGY